MGYKKSVYKSLAMISQVGIAMLVPIFLCSVAGYLLDKKLETSFFFIFLFFVGALAGFRNVFLLAKRVYSNGKGDPLSEYRSRKNGRDS